MIAIRTETLSFDDINDFAKWIGEDKFYKWLIKKYKITKKEWEFFKKNRFLDGFYDYDIIKDWYRDKPEKYIIETINEDQDDMYLLVIKIKE